MPPEQAVVFKNFALKYDASIELMVENYIRHKLEIENGYVEVKIEDEDEELI